MMAGASASTGGTATRFAVIPAAHPGSLGQGETRQDPGRAVKRSSAGAVADKEQAPSAGSTRRRDHRLGSERESRSPPDGQPGDLNRPALVAIEGDQVTARGKGEAKQAAPH